MLGRTGEAHALSIELDTFATAVHLNESYIEDSKAWVLAAGGEIGSARAACERAVALGREMGQRTCAVIALHSLARLGSPDVAEPYLCEIEEELDEGLEGELLLARAEHIHALCERDADRVARAAETFDRLGARLLAAESLADAARAHAVAGARLAASDAAGRARERAMALGVTTPGLTAIHALLPLTQRERDTILMAARGLPNKHIADELGVSPRTIESHLSRSYQKLQITSREELPLLDPDFAQLAD